MDYRGGAYTIEERKMMDETRKILAVSEDEKHIAATCDNLRKGAATNAVQIAQLLHERGLASAEQRAARGVAVA